MSRVFEELTAAVYEQQNRRKRELSGTAVERDLIAGFHRVRQTEHAFPKASSPPDNSTTNEGTSKTTESEINPDRPEFPMNEHGSTGIRDKINATVLRTVATRESENESSGDPGLCPLTSTPRGGEKSA